MAATVEIDEINGLNVTTHGITNMNAGNIDKPNIRLSPATAIISGGNSYVKYNSLHFTAMNGASTIGTIKVWVTGTFHNENIITSLGDSSPPAFSTPSTAMLGGNPVATAEPVGANCCIAGNLSSTLSAPGSSNIFSWQVQTESTTAYGYLPQKIFNFSWVEA